MVKATLSLRRFTTPRGAPRHPTGWQLFFRSQPLLHPASLHLTPMGGGTGFRPRLELFFSATINATLSSGAECDRLLLHSRNAEIPTGKGREDKRLLACETFFFLC